MNNKFGNCSCGNYSSLNSKGLCPECVFKNNHGGRSKSEVYQERDRGKPKKVYTLKRSVLKRGKLKTTQKSIDNKKIQRELDEKTYEEVFNSNPNICEECGRQLNDEFRDEEGNIIMRSRFSHILSKGAYPEHRNESWNFNSLCNDCHYRWEFGDRENMNIFLKNKEKVFNNTGKYKLR